MYFHRYRENTTFYSTYKSTWAVHRYHDTHSQLESDTIQVQVQVLAQVPVLVPFLLPQ